MFTHRSEYQQEDNPFLATQPASFPPQSRPQDVLAGQEPSWLERGAASTKSTPELARRRARLLSHWVEATSDDSFERLTRGKEGEYLSEKDAPAQLTLPKEMTAGMAKAWRQSHPQGRSLEQGGLMVRDQDGSTAWLHGGHRSSGNFEPDFSSLRSGQNALAVGHTHPYDQLDAGHINVPFSGEDLSSHTSDMTPRLSIVRSGSGLFASARTQEFEESVEKRGDAGRFYIEDEIKQYYKTVYDCVSGDTRQRAEAATRATSAHFHLLYYAGQRGILKKIDAVAEPQHQECFANATTAQSATK